jgi:adenine-specific DNA methylase
MKKARKVEYSEEVDFNDTECVETRFSKFNSIKNVIKNLNNSYIGNKRELLLDIIKLLDQNNIDFGSALDLFCGGASFSILMKMLGKKIICNDILYSSYLYSKAFIENNKYILSKEETDFLVKRKSKNDNFVLKNFSNRFTEKECEFLDNYYSNIFYLYGKDDVIDKDEYGFKKALAFANIQLYIISRCFLGGNLNNGQIIAESDFRINHNRNSGQEMKFNNIQWKSLISENNSYKNEVYNCDAIEFLEQIKPGIDLAYFDPPYGGQQSDYVEMYDFFECYFLHTLEHKTKNSNKFCNSKNYAEHFVKLIQLSSYVPFILISYNNSSWADIEIIKNIISNYRKIIEVKEVSHRYKYRKNRQENISEYLILAGKK